MSLDRFIESQRGQIIEAWKDHASERLALNLEESALLNHLPHFLDDVVDALRSPSTHWPHSDSAEEHGRHRMHIGADIGSLTEEIALVGEVVLDLVSRGAEGDRLPASEAARLMRVIGRGAAASVSAYAAARDKEIAAEASKHYSFIAHEIRNPLHNARLAVSLLDEPRSERETAAVQQLERSLAQLSDLVDNSLVNARLSGELDLDVSTLAAEDLIESIRDDLAARAAATRMTLETDVKPFDFEADRKIVASALTNLVANAIKFCSEGSKVVLRARASDDRVLFEIEDECGGIPEELVPRLFQPFAQAGKDRSGFGLGLSIVRQAAESHGGAVRLVNRAPVGCCFVLDLPRHHGHRETDKAAD